MTKVKPIVYANEGDQVHVDREFRKDKLLERIPMPVVSATNLRDSSDAHTRESTILLDNEIENSIRQKIELEKWSNWKLK